MNHQGQNKSKAPRNLHIAHRRTPSELTPLMVEQLALQQQLEALQLQQQQLMLQQQQFAQAQAQVQAGFMPIMNPNMGMDNMGTMGNYSAKPQNNNANFNANSNSNSNKSTLISAPSLQPPAYITTGGTFGNFGISTASMSPTKENNRSLFGGGNGGLEASPLNYNDNIGGTPGRHHRSNSISGQSHNRRHSLGLDEAKRAAAVVQAKRNPIGNSLSPQRTSFSSNSGSSGSPTRGSIGTIPSFRFPSASSGGNNDDPFEIVGSPSGRNTMRRHSRSLSITQTTPSTPSAVSTSNRPVSPTRSGGALNSSTSFSPSRRLNSESFEYGTPRGAHNRSNSRNLDTNWRQHSSDIMNGSPSSGFNPGHRSRGSFGNNSISSFNAYNALNASPFSSNGHNNYNNSSPANQLVHHQGGQSQGQRKPLFAPYLPQASLRGLLAEGRLVTGTIRINKKNRSDAYVSTDGLLDADIFICGSRDRNRALEGDFVAIELLDVEDVWEGKREKEEKRKRKDILMTPANMDDTSKTDSVLASGDSGKGGDVDETGAGAIGNGLNRRGSLKQRPPQKRNDDFEVEGQSLLLTEEEELNDQVKPLYAGHVVAIIDRIPAQLFTGTLGLFRPSVQATKERQAAERKDKDIREPTHSTPRPKIVWFKPNDKCVPLMAIPIEQAPKDFVENAEYYANRLFVASMKRWPITSLHPFGTLVEELGLIQEGTVSVDAMFRENNFGIDTYPQSVLGLTEGIIESAAEENLLNEQVEADTIVKNEGEKVEEKIEKSLQRRNFTNEHVISISPDGKIIDQAFHISALPDNEIEFGIHVSDVTHYLGSLESSLAREARKRSTSVFLIQKSMSMFPPQFNDLCALSAGEVKPTLSVVFRINLDTDEIVDTWVGNGLVKSAQVFDYASIEKALAGSDSPELEDVDSSLSLLIQSETLDFVRQLVSLSNNFKKDRLCAPNSVVSLPGFGLLRQLDDEQVKISTNIFDTSIIGLAVDEINVRVNATVAEHIYAGLGSRAFLRRQAVPVLQKLDSFAKKLVNLGLDIDVSSSDSLQRGILEIEDTAVRQSVETLLFKCMDRAKYFVAGKAEIENFEHFYYNLPLYTHFTSPLRRYADIIVHSQLHAVLEDDTASYEVELDTLNSYAEYCNFKKDSACRAQEQSIHLFLSEIISQLSSNTGQIIRDAIVIQVYESAFDVLIPEFGIEKRVHGDQLPLIKAEFDKDQRVLELYWDKDVDSASFVLGDSGHYSNNLNTGGQTDNAVGSASDSNSSIASSSEESLATQQQSPAELSSSSSSKIAQSEEEMLLNTRKGKLSNRKDLDYLHYSRSLPSSPKASLDKSSEQRTASMTRFSNRGCSSRASKTESTSGSIDAYLECVVSHVKNDQYIQEIRELSHVPILLKAGLDTVVPCITVKTLNPFKN
ncbi:RNB-domain-containing protein [Nadsonia fulvescens var. elongata DSM 6958]|uniref:RNB-domain-containing protein n=1 Tax=Nadsonia fulvescens var. elongata DSM 6958 TaxID=857566 RepID=A0A1E3PDN6_9ASCO|nr:RNB-domain-containing protein [Nadsonia fulvescens var. elongata DSM 6958]